MMMQRKTASNRKDRVAPRLCRLSSRVCATALLLAVWLPVTSADESLKDGARQAGHDLGTVLRDIGHGAKKAGKEIGHDAKQAGKAVGGAAKEGGKEFKRAFKSEH